MSITRAELETILLHRRANAIHYVSWDYTTHDGTNADLTDAIASAIRLLGGTVADLANVVTTDIETIPAEHQPALFDAAEFCLVANLRAQLIDVDLVTGPFAAKLSQLAERLRQDWLDLKKLLEEQYGIGGIEPEVGVIEQNFAAHGDEDE